MTEHLQFFLSSLLFAFLVTLLAWRGGFFRLTLPPVTLEQRPTLSQVAGAFILFLSIELLLIPLLAGGYLLFWKGEERNLSAQAQGWFQMMAILLSALGLIFYSVVLPSPKRRGLYWAGREPSVVSALKDLVFGAASWILSYPWVVVVGHLMAMIFLLFGFLPEAEQVAVDQLKKSSQDPLLFPLMLLAIVACVPIAEELLFRGFLQRGLITYLGRTWAIGATSIIFALFHFSMTQGWNNLELLLSLFILSCYLGFIYEKRGAIWAPVGLHMMFNAISVAFIVWQEGSVQ